MLAAGCVPIGTRQGEVVGSRSVSVNLDDFAGDGDEADDEEIEDEEPEESEAVA